jgi:hypothetical protein
VFLVFGFLARILFCTAGGSSFRHATRRQAQENGIILFGVKKRKDSAVLHRTIVIILLAPELFFFNF